MIIDDFRYMWCGTPVQTLSNQRAEILKSINIRRRPHGHALLLLHGFSSSPAVYRELLPVLTMYDAIVCEALPGHADSIAAFGKVCASDWLTAVENTCASLVENYQTLDVMGLSLGGLLACHLSKKFTFNHMYLLAPSLFLCLNITASIQLAHLLQRLGFESLRNSAGNLQSTRHSELTYRQLPISAIIEVLTLINEFEFVSPTCPIDLFLGSFDKVVDCTKIARLFADLPLVKTHWLANSAHVLPLDGDIDSIIACVRNNWPQANDTKLRAL